MPRWRPRDAGDGRLRGRARDPPARGAAAAAPINVTASAMQGDAERALAGRMDAHVAGADRPDRAAGTLDALLEDIGRSGTCRGPRPPSPC